MREKLGVFFFFFLRKAKLELCWESRKVAQSSESYFPIILQILCGLSAFDGRLCFVMPDPSSKGEKNKKRLNTQTDAHADM